MKYQLVDELVDEISDCDVETNLGHYVSHIIMYASDLALLLPSN